MQEVNWQSELRGALQDKLDAFDHAITIADLGAPDQPIILLNKSFERLTGFGQDRLGENCRFLQPEHANDLGKAEIRDALAESRETQVILRNIRADGSEFRNLLLILPLKKGLPLAVGAQFDVGEERVDAEYGQNTLDPDLAPVFSRNLQLRIERRRIVAGAALRFVESWVSLQAAEPKANRGRLGRITPMG